MPCEGSLAGPALRDNNKALGVVGALGNFDCASIMLGDKFSQRLAAIAAIGKEVRQRRNAFNDNLKGNPCAIPVLNTGFMNSAVIIVLRG